MNSFFEYFIASFVTGMLLFFAYLCFVVAPVMLYAEIQCLRQGYPKYSVAINLESYCLNLEGTVTVKVKPQ